MCPRKEQTNMTEKYVFFSFSQYSLNAKNGKTMITMIRDSDSVNTNSDDDDNGYNGKSKRIV